MRRKNLTFLFLSIGLAVLGLESAFRLLASADYHNQRYWRYCQPFGLIPGALTYDARLGFFHSPNLDVRFKNDEFDTRVRTNSLGFRDDEDSLKDPEVLFLGDSFCFGWGVEDHETCESVFQAISSHKSLNMGVAGYHTVQENLLYQGFCESHDIREATVVLLAFCDDPVGSATLFRTFPRVRKSGVTIAYASPAGESVYTEFLAAQRSPWLKRVSRISCLGDLLIKTIYRPDAKMRRFLEDADDKDAKELGYTVPPFEAFEYVLRDISAYSKGRSNRLIVALVPRLEDLTSRPNVEYRAMESILSSMGVPHLLLADALQPDDYLPRDRHWNRKGQATAAQAIERFLKSPNSRVR